MKQIIMSSVAVLAMGLGSMSVARADHDHGRGRGPGYGRGPSHYHGPVVRGRVYRPSSGYVAPYPSAYVPVPVAPVPVAPAPVYVQPGYGVYYPPQSGLSIQGKNFGLQLSN